MKSLKSIAQGFLIAAGLVWFFMIVALFKGGDAWLGLLYLIVLLIPLSSLTWLKVKNVQSQAVYNASDKLRYLLFSFQGVALAFWIFDIATTFYAINITGLAVELNPLGWPLGILGAFVYYVPTLVFCYVLLFRIEGSFSICVAGVITLLTLGMSAMNLVAGAQNLQVFVGTAAVAMGVRYGLLALLVSVNLIASLEVKRMQRIQPPQTA
jgi:hypothetical protein